MKRKKVNEVTCYAAISLPRPGIGEAGGLIAWSVGWSHYEVLETMRRAYWKRSHYRIAKCRLVEIEKKRKVKRAS